MLGWRAWVFGLLLVGFAIFAVINSHTFQECIGTSQSEIGSAVLSVTLSRLQACFGLALTENNSAITVLATLLVALFTGTLWWSTYKLWHATKDAAHATEQLTKIAATQLRDQEAIQRAYISAEAEGLNPLLGDARPEHFVIGHVNFRNGGHIPARNFRWYATIDSDPCGLREDFPIPPTNKFEGTTIIAPGSAMKFGTKEFEVPAVGWIYLWGAFTYDDGFVPDRFATFCHRYNRGALRKVSHSGHGISADDARIHRFGNTEQK
jgi:hypothetical protein